jgi:hypothetical protein
MLAFIYLDNNLASAISRRDQCPMQQACLDRLIDAHANGHVEIRISRHTDREMEKAPSKYQANLKKGIKDIGRVFNDHKVLDFFELSDPYGGFIFNPIVTDIPDPSLFTNLCSNGLDYDDAKQVLDAALNGMTFFVTCDKKILHRRNQIESLLASVSRTMVIGNPCEVCAELGI